MLEKILNLGKRKIGLIAVATAFVLMLTTVGVYGLLRYRDNQIVEDTVEINQNITPQTLIVYPAQCTGCQYVGGDGIQGAINAAHDGDTILIKEGTYTRSGGNYSEANVLNGRRRKVFALIYDKNITVQGEGNVIITQTEGNNIGGFYVVGNGTDVKTATIKNLTVTGLKDEVNSCNDTERPCALGIGVYCFQNNCNVLNSKINSNSNIGLLCRDKSICNYRNNNVENNLIIGLLCGSQSICTIENNFISVNLRGIASSSNSKSYIYNNSIENNRIDGIVVYISAEANIKNNIIRDNLVSGIYVYNLAKADIVNNSIYRNKRVAINVTQPYIENNPSVTVINNIITATSKNTDGYGFGIGGNGLHEAGKLDNDIFKYNLIWGNEGDNTDCANEELCEAFEGRLNTDPQYVSPTDLHLKSYSPAVNAGDPTILDPDGTRSDMGAYGGPGACGLDPTIPGCTTVPADQVCGNFSSRTFVNPDVNTNIESIVKGTKLWEYDVKNNTWLTSKPITDPSLPYVKDGGPCKVAATCANGFDTRMIDRGTNIESITIGSKFWNYNLRNQSWIDSGLDLVSQSIERFKIAGGPCDGKGLGECKFDTRTVFNNIEYITIGSQMWVADIYNPAWTKINLVSTNSKYGDNPSGGNSGPCAGKATGCVFDTHTFYTDGRLTLESITIADKYWNYKFDNSDGSGGGYWIQSNQALNNPPDHYVMVGGICAR